MARGINLQKFLCGCARSCRFGNWLSVLVFRIACRRDDVEKDVRSFLFLSLLAVNKGQSEIRGVRRHHGRIHFRDLRVKHPGLIEIAVGFLCLGQRKFRQRRDIAASVR